MANDDLFSLLDGEDSVLFTNTRNRLVDDELTSKDIAAINSAEEKIRAYSKSYNNYLDEYSNTSFEDDITDISTAIGGCSGLVGTLNTIINKLGGMSGGSVSAGGAGGSDNYGGAGGDGNYTAPTASYATNPEYTPPTASYTTNPEYTPPTSSYTTNPEYTPPSVEYRQVGPSSGYAGGSGGYGSGIAGGAAAAGGALAGAVAHGGVDSFFDNGRVTQETNYPYGNYNVTSAVFDGISKEELKGKLEDIGFTDDEIKDILNGNYDVSTVLVDEVADKLEEAYKKDAGIRDKIIDKYGFDVFNPDGSVNKDKLSLALCMDDKTGKDKYSMISMLRGYGINVVDKNQLDEFTKDFEALIMNNYDIRKQFMDKYGFDIFEADGTINKDRLALAMLIDKKSNGAFSLEKFISDAKANELVSSLGNHFTKFASSKEETSKLPYLAGGAALAAAGAGIGIAISNSNAKSKEEKIQAEKDEEARKIKKETEEQQIKEEQEEDARWINKMISEELAN